MRYRPIMPLLEAKQHVNSRGFLPPLSLSAKNVRKC